MNEEQKDRIEDMGSMVVEAAVALIPVVGGAAAVLTNRALGSAVQRRQAKILIELRDDLTRLEQSGLVRFGEHLAESDVIQAALHRTVRQLLESGSDERRTLLRHALLNRFIGTHDADRFAEALDRIQPRDLPLLQLIAKPASYEKAADMETLLQSEDEAQALERKRRLKALNLLIDTAGDHPDDAAARQFGNIDGKARGNDLRPYWSNITDLGRDFLAYISDPTHTSMPASTETAPQ